MEIAIAICYRILANAAVVKSWTDASKPSPANRYWLQDLAPNAKLVGITDHPGFNHVYLKNWSPRLASDKKQMGRRGMVKLDQKKGEFSLYLAKLDSHFFDMLMQHQP